MYKHELEEIWKVQKQFFRHLPDDFMQENKGIKRIIFYQRPLKLRKDRVGKCSLEKRNVRAAQARLEVQEFRYLQDVNNLKYFDPYRDAYFSLNEEQRQILIDYFENNTSINITTLRKLFGFDKKTKFNLEMKNLKGNITAHEIKSVIEENWNQFDSQKRKALVEDLLSIKKKSALKKRLINHWGFQSESAIKLCLLEFEPGHSSHSLKAINKLLPYLCQGMVYSDARIAAGYNYETKEIQVKETLSKPPETSNPIVNKGLSELRRVINAIVKHYGKPDVIRIEMARDLEMNTKRYKAHQSQQKKNQKANEEASKAFRNELKGKYPSRDDKIRYRLWKDQYQLCAYSNRPIKLSTLFTAEVDVDHILPRKKSLDDSYMNKVVCFVNENRTKGDRTPIDAWQGNEEKWNQITQAISQWKGLDAKVKRFYTTEKQLQERDFISNQLNDTRYLSKLAMEYVKQLGCDVTTCKGKTTAWLRHQWGLNNILGETDKKERTDHRHHALDAAVIACADRSLYNKIYSWTKNDIKKLVIESPYPEYRAELAEHLSHVLVSHAPQRKLSGGLHEETGAGYIEKHGGLVYRQTLNSEFNEKSVKKILDPTVRVLVAEHLAKHNGKSKEAFADGVTFYHKDGKTPIKRVRVLQSKTNLKKLEQSKFGIKDKTGKIFKWMAYGNMHHVEILEHKETGKYKAHFITMMHAAHRAKGIKSHLNPTREKQTIVKKEYGEKWNFLMALHINDTVSIGTGNNVRSFYRVQKLDSGSNRFVLRASNASTLNNKKEELYVSINREKFMEIDIRLHNVNAIGIINDQKNH